MKIQGENGSGSVVAGLAAAVLVVACREPSTVIPDIPKAAESARAAAAAAAKSAEGPPPEAPRVLVEEAFKAEPPSGVCSISTSTPCMFDGVVGGVAEDITIVKREGKTAFFGWAAVGTTTSIPPVVLVELVGAAKKFYATATRAKRPDVAAALKEPAFIDAGYDILASFRNVEPGEYGVQIVQITAAGTGLTCDTRRKVRVE